MELLVWHDALGSDDEQATEEELLMRVLYAYDSVGVLDEGNTTTGAKRLQTLHFVQGLVNFSRLLRRVSTATGEQKQWSSIVLSKRRFFIQQVEPQVFMALGVLPSPEDSTELKSAQGAVLQTAYDLFRLFHGAISLQLRDLNPALCEDPTWTDGMALLGHLQTLRKQLRKANLAIEMHSHDTIDDDSPTASSSELKRLEEEVKTLKNELLTLEPHSPATRVRQRCHAFFPKLLRCMDAQLVNAFHCLYGLSTASPSDSTTALSLQSAIHTLRQELVSDLSHVALFYRGQLHWSSLENTTLDLLTRFLQYREQDGMDDITWTEQGEPPSTLWMRAKSHDAFLPVWASKTSYAECAVVTHVAPQPRRAQRRSMHKLIPATSLNALVSDVQHAVSAGKGKSNGETVDVVARLRTQRYRPNGACYRNRGFLTEEGAFASSWELNDSAHDAIWAPTVRIRTIAKDDNDSRHRCLLWHEADVTLILLSTGPTEVSTALLERIEQGIERIQLVQLMESLTPRATSVTSSTIRTRSNASGTTVPLPPHVFFDSARCSLQVAQIPRLLRVKDMEDQLPRIPSLYAHYLPRAHLQRLTTLQHVLADHRGESRELCVKTVHSGWVVARRVDRETKPQDPSERALFAFVDTKVASLRELDETMRPLRQPRAFS